MLISCIVNSDILQLCKVRFFETYAVSKEKGHVCDMTEGLGLSIPHSMLRLLMCLANSPTDIGKHVSLDELFVIETYYKSQSDATFIEQDTIEENITDSGYLQYDDWRAQCDKESNEDEAWSDDDDNIQNSIYGY